MDSVDIDHNLIFRDLMGKSGGKNHELFKYLFEWKGQNYMSFANLEGDNEPLVPLRFIKKILMITIFC